MKSLKNIMIVAKVFKILCLIMFILTIIAASFIVLTMATYAEIVNSGIVIDGKTIAEMLAEKGITTPLMYLAMSVSLVGCGLVIFSSKNIELYCKKILESGNPFTREMVKHTKHVALVQVIVSGSVIVVSFLLNTILKGVFKDQIAATPSVPGFVCGFIALVLLILSFFLEYPVEVEEQRKEQRENQINPEDYQE